MSRREELFKAIDGNDALIPMISEALYLEEQLEYLRTLPKIKVHPSDATKQKATPAARLYKEMLQQYTNIIRILLKVTDSDIDSEESPLRAWMRQNIKENE